MHTFVFKSEAKFLDPQHTPTLCDIRTLARRAYRAHPHLIDQIVLTSFIEGLQSSTLRWELRKTKPSTADEALTLAIELDSFLALERQNNALTSFSFPRSVNSIAANISQPDPMDELVKSLRNEIDELKSSIHRKRNSPERRRRISTALVTPIGTETVPLNRNIIDKISKEETTNGDPTGLTTEVIHETEQQTGQFTIMTDAPRMRDKMVSKPGRFDSKRTVDAPTTINPLINRINQCVIIHTVWVPKITSRWNPSATKHLPDTNPKIKYVDIVREETMHLMSVKPVLIAFVLDISEKTVLCNDPTRKTKTVYATGSSRRL